MLSEKEGRVCGGGDGMGGDTDDAVLVIPFSTLDSSSYGGVGDVRFYIKKWLMALIVFLQNFMKSDFAVSTIFGLHILRMFLESRAQPPLSPPYTFLPSSERPTY